MVGVGGAGMSAVAHVLQKAGITVSGSDVRESAVLSALRASGIRASVGHRAEQAAGAHALIVSSAVPPDNPEVRFARLHGIPVMARGEALARIVASMRTVAVSGTHGKTTTSGMAATVAVWAGLDPTYLLGAGIAWSGAGGRQSGSPGAPGRSRPGWGGRLGGGQTAVVEADEAYRSFLWLTPAVSVVTNIDRDHMDHYGTWDSLLSAFRAFMSRTAEAVVVCADDAPAMQVAAGLQPMTYGLGTRANVRGANVQTVAGGSSFDLVIEGASCGRINLQVAGKHNVQNALGAAAACLQLNVDVESIRKGLESFEGVSRRFEFRGRFAGADLVDDYAHHPAEIDATLSAARSGPWKRVVAVFQPHLYSRTAALWREFGAALSAADVVVVTDVYGAREDPVAGVTGKLIVESVCEFAPGRCVAYLPRLNEAARYLVDIVREDDLVLTLGAGDVTTLSDRLAGEAGARLDG